MLASAYIAVAWVTFRPVNVRRRPTGDGYNHPGWEDYLLSTCSDGAHKMLGRVRGIVSRIAQPTKAAGHSLIRF
jgi:hypothetical protein